MWVMGCQRGSTDPVCLFCPKPPGPASHVITHPGVSRQCWGQWVWGQVRSCGSASQPHLQHCFALPDVLLCVPMQGGSELGVGAMHLIAALELLIAANTQCLQAKSV